jgi:biotin carboxyl carrier protein
MALEITVTGGTARAVDLARHGTRATITIDGRGYAVALGPAGSGQQLTVESRSERVHVVVDHDVAWVHAFGRAWELSLIDPVERAAGAGASEDVATAPMPGTVIAVVVTAGQEVAQGEQLVVIESMKMQSEIVALRDGVVEHVHLEVGATFERGAPLVRLVPLADATGDSDGDGDGDGGLG